MNSNPLNMNSNPLNIRPKKQWINQLLTGLCIIQLLSGLLSIFENCFIAGLLQIICATVILAIESSFLHKSTPILKFAENKLWQKIILYIILFFLPFILSCFSTFFLVGQLCALIIIIIIIIQSQRKNMAERITNQTTEYIQNQLTA